MVVVVAVAVAHIVVLLLGIVLVLGTLLSAVRTVVLPRAEPVTLTWLVFTLVRRAFDIRTHKARSYEQRDAVMALYAPVALLTLPGVWLALVAGGYTAIFWALSTQTASTAFTVSGSSLLTLGFATVPGMLGTALTFSEAAIGLLLAALLIAFLPTMYSTFARRETAVTMLEVRAGSPPSATELFARYHRLQRFDKLNDLWVSWEVWFAEVAESHTSFPALAYFRSPLPGHSWITAAGAVLDSAALAVSTIDIPQDVQANLCIRAGFLSLRRIGTLFGVPFNAAPTADDPISISREEFDAACDELASLGVPIKADRAAAWQAFAGWRVNYDMVLVGLATITMAPYAPWSSDRSLVGQRRLLFRRHDS